jgi:sugar phosphate isomerase/epimerase
LGDLGVNFYNVNKIFLMNRRKFVQNTSLSLLALPLMQTWSCNTAAARSTKKIIVGAHVWVYASTQPGYDVSPILEQIFSDVSYAGFDGVETMEHPLRSTVYTNQIRELIEKYKIKLIGSSYSGEMWDRDKQNQIYEDVENIFTNMALVGGRTFGVSVGEPAGREKTETEFDNQAELLKKLISLGEKKGIVLNLHNHTAEVKNNMYDLRGTLKRTPDIKLGPDLNWLLRAGINPVDFLREFKKQIVFLHLRDQLNNGKWPESMGEGDVDFKEIENVLKEINFSGDAIIELAHENGFVLTRPLKESLKMSRDYLKQTMSI